MRRLLGTKKEKKPTATLDDATGSLDARGAQIDQKIQLLDQELMKHKMTMKKQKKGTGAYRNTQQRAMRVLKQKKMYEKQRDQVYNQSFNIDQAKFATESVKDTATMVEAMTAANKELKTQYKSFNIDSVEDMVEDMGEMMEMAEEFNEVLGRSYGVPEEVDEQDLLDELDGLEDELEMGETEEVPDYLVSAASATNKSSLSSKANASNVQLDEFGLPKVALNNLEA